MTLVWLPGLDGHPADTVAHWEPLREVVPFELLRRSRFVRLPATPTSYDGLAGWLRSRLPDGPKILIAESFSGPLALRLAGAPGVAKVVLVVSFVRPPRAVPPWLISTFGGCALRVPPPELGLRWLLLGDQAPPARVTELRSLLTAAGPDPMAQRLTDSLREDATEALRTCPARLFYLRPRHDRMVPQAAVDHILHVRPDVEVAEIDGPHLVLQANPEAAWAALAPWIAPDLKTSPA